MAWLVLGCVVGGVLAFVAMVNPRGFLRAVIGSVFKHPEALEPSDRFVKFWRLLGVVGVVAAVAVPVSAENSRRAQPPPDSERGLHVRGAVPLAGYTVSENGKRVHAWSPYYVGSGNTHFLSNRPDSGLESVCWVEVDTGTETSEHSEVTARLVWWPIHLGDVEDYSEQCRVEKLRHDDVKELDAPHFWKPLAGAVVTKNPVVKCVFVKDGESGDCRNSEPVSGDGYVSLPEYDEHGAPKQH